MFNEWRFSGKITNNPQKTGLYLNKLSGQIPKLPLIDNYWQIYFAILPLFLLKQSKIKSLSLRLDQIEEKEEMAILSIDNQSFINKNYIFN